MAEEKKGWMKVEISGNTEVAPGVTEQVAHGVALGFCLNS